MHDFYIIPSNEDDFTFSIHGPMKSDIELQDQVHAARQAGKGIRIKNGGVETSESVSNRFINVPAFVAG